MALSDKHARFVSEYLIDLNATQAAIRAGYSPDSARSTGPEILLNPEVKAAVDTALAETARRNALLRQRVIDELEILAFANIRDYVDVDTMTFRPGVEVPEVVWRAISSIQIKRGGGVEFKLCDKITALTKLGQHLGVMAEKHELSGPGGSPIQTESKVEHSGKVDLFATIGRYEAEILEGMEREQAERDAEDTA